MEYFITFIEGFISFISPCMLPMLPIYVSYFAGGGAKKSRTLLCALCFVLGFTAVFTSLGLFAGSLGVLLGKYRVIVNVVCGAVIVIFGLSYLEVIRLPIFRGMDGGMKINGPVSALIFGVIYSVSLTPCVGAFLGSALMLASSEGGAVRGTLLLLAYSLGLGIPFVVCAVLIDKFRGAIGFIKRHYRVINLVCGIFLIIVGILMACGVLGVLLDFFS